MNKFSRKPLSIALGAAFALGGVNAQGSVFQATDLAGGYMVAAADQAKSSDRAPTDGHCGGMRMMEGRCGEGMCGGRAFDMMDANKDGKLSKDEYVDWHDKNWSDGMCGAYMKMPDGRCGKGVCGGNVKK